MSLLNPELVPVKIYRSSDTGAPVLDKTAGCFSRILKACLATGYGAKPSAGWTMTHEDAATHARVFDINSGILPSVSLRIYNDTGVKFNIQVAKDVINANTVSKVIESTTPFKSGGGAATGVWTLIATDRGFWFFAPVNARNGTSTQSGAFLFAGVVPGSTSSAFIIKHSGGSFDDTDIRSITSSTLVSDASGRTSPMIAYMLNTSTTATGDPKFISDGNSNSSDVSISSNLYFLAGGDVYQLPILSPSRNDLLNFDTVPEINAMNFCTSMRYNGDVNNAYVPVGFWSY